MAVKGFSNKEPYLQGIGRLKTKINQFVYSPIERFIE